MTGVPEPAPTRASSASADCAANRLEPSTSAFGVPAPVTIATSTALSRSMSRASASSSVGAVVVTSKKSGREPATCSACGPTTAVSTVET